ncbi:MAG: hypothetical protein KGP28_00815 [Bdellovibrionales bacterium]|nr:hypothetical protein [Bdellovibrionales bacterium]
MSSVQIKWMFFLLLLLGLGQGGRIWWHERHSLIHGVFAEETYEPSIPENLDREEGAFMTVSFGYHLVPWPKFFEGDPVVSTMDYQKGPPSKFITRMTQIWSPGNAEVIIEGPRTPETGVTVDQWKSCLQSVFCVARKNRFIEIALKDLIKQRSRLKKVVWFESPAVDAGRGLRLEFDLDEQMLERFVIITDSGNTQNFSLRYAKNEIGKAAHEQFRKLMTGFTLRDDLKTPREWISTRLKGVALARIASIPDPKIRYQKWIETQNLLFSQIAIDPRNVAPFFHLAGVTHLLGMSLLKEKKSYFKNQESWILLVQPLLSTLIQYVGDFPEAGKEKGERSAALANMDSLLQDFLLLKKKLSK